MNEGTEGRLTPTKGSFTLAPMLTPKHVRAARAVLGWGVRDLARQCGVSSKTVTRYENGGDIRKSTADQIQGTLEAAGVEIQDSRRPGISWAPEDG